MNPFVENVGHLMSATRAALPSPSKIAHWVFSCFRTPPNSDVDYRIFNVRTWSFKRGIHTGVGHTDKSAQHFVDSEKNHYVFLVLLMESNLGDGMWSATLYQ